jgi:hypothetical protein
MGLGIDFGLDVTTQNDGNVSLHILPTFILQHGAAPEVVPHGGIRINEAGSDVTLTGGCGFYFPLIQNEVFSFLLGPDAYMDIDFFDDGPGGPEWGVEPGCRCPLLIEYSLTQRIFMRTRLNLAGISLPIIHYNRPAPVEDETEVDLDLGIDTTPSWFSLSFYYLL